MSGRGGGGGGNGGKGNNGVSAIPAASRKMVQSLKEIVNNCTELEIYAALKECNMDPNEAINRLLSQDPFHEVRSKKGKKKETKDPTDSRSRGANSASNRVGKGGTDRHVGRGGSNQYSSTDSGSLHGKTAYKKENGTHAYPGSSSSASTMAGNNMSRRPPLYSDSVAMENKMLTVDTSDDISLSTHSSGFQSPWLGVPGHVSMADIVKMGRPHGKASNVSNLATSSGAIHHDSHSLQDHASKVSDLNVVSGLATNQHLSPNDEWPAIEQPPATTVSSVVGEPSYSEPYADPSNLPLGRGSHHMKSQLDEVQVADDLTVDMLNASHVRPASVSSRSMHEENSGSASVFDNTSYNDISSYQPHKHALEHNEVSAEDDISSVAADLQHLNIQEDDQVALPEEDNPPVIIPNHLQLHTSDCLNLSFGSFGSGNSAAFSVSGSFATRPLKSDLEETSTAQDVSSIGHSESRQPEYFGDEHIGTTSEGNLVNRNGGSTSNYDSSPVSQPEVLKQQTPEVAQGNQYAFASSAPDFTYESPQQFNAAFTHPQTSSQMQNLASFSSVMQAYTNSLPGALLASTAQTAREDLQYSPFPVTLAMPAKYSNVASISGPTISMPESLGAGSISTPLPNPQTLPGASVATGPALPQHLAVHPYSQPNLPLGHFANMIGYPFMPQNYTYMPSAFQQAFAGNNTYHQSLATVLPQYKNSVSVSSLPQSAAIASGYAFGSSTSIPGGNFPLNQPAMPTGTTVGYDDVNSQYKDSNHLISLQQQSDNSAMWVHGPGSRTVSALPSTYYSFQGQNQQPSGYRQAQQPSQHFGALGYPNFYHSQAGLSMEHQQQNPRDAALGGSQGQQPSKQSQQIWQNSY